MIVALYFLVGAIIVTGLASDRRKVGELIAAIVFWPVFPGILAVEIFKKMLHERSTAESPPADLPVVRDVA